ncbi:hypothetical protein B0O80DRAFT_485064 [Mortierella sp. GBAus27b]|nr:hypothetical protein B0O80DRAFT_485064 [Mortierella sp. GBAus27b]
MLSYFPSLTCHLPIAPATCQSPMTMTPGFHERVHPLLLPDILILLGSFLSKGDLFKATLVCRCWSNVLNPQLWKSVVIDTRFGGQGCLYKQEHSLGLEQHLHFIRSLDVSFLEKPRLTEDPAQVAEERLKTILKGCQRLTQLSTNVLYEDLFEMLDKNRETITRFEWLAYGESQDQHLTLRLWNVLSDGTDTGGMRHLKHLRLRWVIIQPGDGHSTPHSTFAKLCLRLETLELRCCTLTYWPISMSGLPQDKDNGDSSLPMFWNMRKVTFYKLEGDLASHQRFLSQWHLPSTFTTLALEPSTWDVNIGPRSIAAAAALNLPSLSLLSSCDDPLELSSDLIQQLFSSCLCLVRLDVRPCIMIAKGPAEAPWIASRLVQLDLLIAGVEEMDTCEDPTCTCGGGGTCSGQSIIYEQLSRLVSLEDLSLAEGVNHYALFDGPRIDFSLRHGMGKLVTLERLRRLDIRKLEGLKMGLEEGAWIRDHWPALDRLKLGHFHCDLSIHDMVMTYLHENRPRLWITQTWVLFNATLVCRCWNNVLNPQLWKSVVIATRFGGQGCLYKQEHSLGLEQHLHFVRSLDVWFLQEPRLTEDPAQVAEERLKTILKGCQRLTQLSTNALHEDLFTMLDKNQETITRFEWLAYGESQDQHVTLRLWNVLSDGTDTGGMRHLMHLRLRWVIIQPGDGHSTLRSAFAKLCQRLETLELSYCTLTDLPIFTSELPKDKDNGDSSPPMFWNLREVTFYRVIGPLATYERFLSQCPLLERLTWCLQTVQESTPEFLRYLAQSRLKFLEIRGIFLSDELFAQLLEHLPSTFTTLSIPPSAWIVHMGPRFVAAAAALTLPSLSLLSTSDDPLKVFSDIIHQLFSSCTCLVRLDLDLLIVGVEKLDACVDPTCTCGGGGTCGGQSIIYEQLSRLVSLEDLSLAEGVGGTGPLDGPRIGFSLRHGMGKLVTLERLRRLDIRKLKGLKMGLEEGAWIRDHWPALDRLKLGHFHCDLSIHDMVMAYLHENRPRLWITQTWDLFKATLVCRCWSNVLNPQLWKSVVIDTRFGGQGCLYKQEHSLGLEQHLHFIRSLDVSFLQEPRLTEDTAQVAEERLKTILKGCQRLTQLSTNALHEDLFEMLDKNRETITRFEWLAYGESQDQHLTLRLWNVLSDGTDTGGMRHLKHLRLRWVIIQPGDGHSTPHSTFAKLCQRLETLELRCCTLTYWPISMSGLPQDKDNGDSSLPMFWNMRKVTFYKLEGDLASHQRFLSQWELTPVFLRYLAQSRLKSLVIKGMVLSDEFLAQVMGHLPSTFTTLALVPSTWDVNMGPRSIAAAAALTLPSLSLLSSSDDPLELSSNLIQQLFSSCTCLVRLDVRPRIMIAKGPAEAPWIASRLVQLDLLIADVEELDTCEDPTCTCGGDGTCGGGQSIIYEQLSRLVSLEDLSLAEGLIRYTPLHGRSRIHFSLRHGMGKLVTLERLRRLDIRKLEGLKMGLEEGAWICNHWPALQYLTVHHFEQDNTIHDNLMSYLHENRPKLWITQI